MIRFNRAVLLALALVQVVTLVAGSYEAGAVSAQQSTEIIKPERGNSKEYYYIDGQDIYADGGQYKEKVKFIKKYGDNVYVPDGDSFEVNPESTKDDSSICASGTVPIKLWDKDEAKSSTEPAFFLNILPKGGAELDLTIDQEDGVFRWGKVVGRDNINPEERREKVPVSIDKGTMARDLTKIPIDADGDIHIQNTDVECAYFYFKHFHRLIAPYDDETLKPGPLAGRILGIAGMKFDDYVVRADNRLAYRAYTQSARQNTIEHCNRKLDIYKCINDVDAAYQKCYSQSVGAQYEMYTYANDLKRHAEWDKPFDADKFVECFKSQNQLVAAEYFTDDKDMGDFAEKLISETILPPSLKPLSADAIPESIEADSDTQCSIGMLGWILCPAFSFVASVNDKVFNILKNWLVLAPFQQAAGGSNGAAYSVWEKSRNFVNAAFLLFFLIMVYAQVTGRGIQTYGTKALIPRMVVGALLLNLSYIICGVAVDLSNALGDSLFNLLAGIRLSGAGIEGAGGWENVTASITLGGGAAAGTLALIANLSALVPIMIMALVALVSTFLLLLLRQALIIIFVAFAPFAFILFILPGTMSWFKKWRSTFIQLLMLYPAFSLMFAGSQIAAEIVRDTAAQSNDTLLTIFSLGIQVIPLFLLPFVMKVGGGVLNRFGGIINNPNKGLFDRARNRADEFRKDRKTKQQTRALNGRAGVLGYGTLIRMNQRRKAKLSYRKQNASRAQQAYFARNQDGIARSAAGLFASKDFKDQIRDLIQGDATKEQLEEYEAASTLIDSDRENISDQELLKMANGQGDHSKINEGEQAAAMSKVIESGNVKNIDEMLGQLHADGGKLTDLQKNIIIKSAQAAGTGGMASHLSASNLERALNSPPPRINTGNASADAIANKQAFTNSLYSSAAEHGAYTPEAMASQDSDAIRGMHAAIASGAISAVHASGIKQSFAAAASDAKLSGIMSVNTRKTGNELLR